MHSFVIQESLNVVYGDNLSLIHNFSNETL